MTERIKDWLNNWKIKNNLKDWKINKEEGMAEHKSGVGFRYIPDGENGKPRVEILNMPEWFQSEMEQGKSLDECKEILKKLNNQFVDIHKNIMTSKKKNNLINHSMGNGYDR